MIKQAVIGAPCWFELSSTDSDKSKAFLQQVFGWRANDIDMGPMGTYSMLHNGQGTVAAAWDMPASQKSQGMLSYWGVYFLVQNVDDSTALATKLGANVLVPPMDVNSSGRMSVISDPTGATCNLWQANVGGGGDFIMYQTHAIGWVELATRDLPGARRFYGELLGWQYRDTPMPTPNFEPDATTPSYTQILVPDERFGGILRMDDSWAGIAPHWSIYVVVHDTDATLATAIAAGGKVVVPAFDAPGIGRIAMLSDPTGATCYVIALAK